MPAGISHREKCKIWREHVAASITAAAPFCAHHGLKRNQLGYWFESSRNEATHVLQPELVSIVKEEPDFKTINFHVTCFANRRETQV